MRAVGRLPTEERHQMMSIRRNPMRMVAINFFTEIGVAVKLFGGAERFNLHSCFSFVLRFRIRTASGSERGSRKKQMEETTLATARGSDSVNHFQLRVRARN